jgi:hypothetical protein
MSAHRLLLGTLVPLLLVLVPSCAKVEFDIWRAKVGENTTDLYRGKDRGYFGYRQMIEDATIRGSGIRRYQYVKPAHVSNYLVTRAVRGLGGTNWPGSTRRANTDYMAGTVDRLLDVLYRDPTPSVRQQVCSQLGRVARRLSLMSNGPIPEDPYELLPGSDVNIRQTTSDLVGLQTRINKGERISQKFVVAALEEFHANPPRRSLLALDMMRAASSRPIAAAPPGPIRDAARTIVPRLCLRAISITLTELACGSLVASGANPDESDRVRLRAIQVLTSLRDPTAREAAAGRLWNDLDPLETSEPVKSAILVYLGTVGGPHAFEAAVRQLDHGHTSVRFHAQAALITMTGVRMDADANAWRGWRSKNPKWRIPETYAAESSSDEPSSDGSASAGSGP